MSSPILGDKYILYLPPAVEDWNRIDKSLCLKIERQITNFQDDWNPSRAFSKDPDDTGTDNIYQIKHNRGSMRAFATWWNMDDIHVLCVICLYKKTNEDDHWAYIDEYDEQVQERLQELTQLHHDGELREKLDNLEDHPDFRVIPP